MNPLPKKIYDREQIEVKSSYAISAESVPIGPLSEARLTGLSLLGESTSQEDL